MKMDCCRISLQQSCFFVSITPESANTDRSRGRIIFFSSGSVLQAAACINCNGIQQQGDTPVSSEAYSSDSVRHGAVVIIIEYSAVNSSRADKT